MCTITLLGKETCTEGKLWLCLFNFYCPILTKKINVVDRNKKAINSWYDDSLRKKRETLTLINDLLKIPMYSTDLVKQFYIRCKQDYMYSVRQAKIKYNDKKICQSQNKCSAAWKLIKSETGNNKHDSNPPPIAPEVFNDYYISVGKNVVESLKPEVSSMCIHNYKSFLENIPPVNIALKWNKVSSTDILKIVRSLKSSNSEDVYGLSNSTIKSVITSILEPLTYLVNLMFLKGIFPQCLKNSKTVPIFKKGNKLDPASYHPISIVPFFFSKY